MPAIATWEAKRQHTKNTGFAGWGSHFGDSYFEWRRALRMIGDIQGMRIRGPEAFCVPNRQDSPEASDPRHQVGFCSFRGWRWFETRL